MTSEPEAATGSRRGLAPMPANWQRALAIAAHPDDLEYGAVAAVAEWTDAGREVAYTLVTRGEAGIDGVPPAECAPLREAEQRASAAVAGVTEVTFLDHRDGMIEDGLRLRRDLVAQIRRHRPELLLTINHHDTWGGTFWNTPDHRVVGRAVLDAAGAAGNRWIFPELLTEEGLRPWDGVRWTAVAGSPFPTHAHEVDAGIERAVASLTEHAAYIRGLGAAESDPAAYAREFVTGMLRRSGEEHRGRPAVTFELHPR
ncbi:PIG-L deacetylase family protein [Streptomyces sp. NPDC059740]|uniref:PIG-L deacetylase family protein n=1 Tax=Streptomyces sp. NPDC059740 TaxID=3346926 RepID=UPI0036567C15